MYMYVYVIYIYIYIIKYNNFFKTKLSFIFLVSIETKCISARVHAHNKNLEKYIINFQITY